MPRQHLKPFAWYGGKEALAPVLCSLLPVHEVYCEVFGGSGALLFAKAKSRLEVFNDLDGGVVNFFRVLRSAEQMEELVRLLTLTPYAYEEYYDCLKQWEATADPVERARQWYVGVMQSMNSSIRNTGWSSTKDPGSNPARSWPRTPDRFEDPWLLRERGFQGHFGRGDRRQRLAEVLCVKEHLDRLTFNGSLDGAGCVTHVFRHGFDGE